MRQSAHVVAPDEFDRWLAGQAARTGLGSGGDATAGTTGTTPADGKAIFAGAAGCTKCHTLADAGATATIGPNLDKELPALSKADIQQSIATPDAKITPGYSPGVMPSNFEQTLGADGVKAVVNYLAEVSR
jgi:cytochrome c551/c552